jgi:hypothetical protein
VKLRWKKYELGNPNRGGRAWTAGRERAAVQAVRREAESVPLFPELRRFVSVEERKRMVEDVAAEFRARLRNSTAMQWRKARAELRALPQGTREGVLRYWTVCGCPAAPSYLLGLIREQKRGVSMWGKLRWLHLLRKKEGAFRHP